MTFEGWLVFATFWALFVTTPGPNAANCIENGMRLPFGRAMVAVAAILTQATAFLLLSAVGVAALILAAPGAFFWARLVGAAVLIWLGIRGWRRARAPLGSGEDEGPQTIAHVYFRALLIATVNAKSLAGYLAAFTQFVQPDVPVWEQMGVIVPTALTLTTLSYTGYTLLGAALGRMALGALGNLVVRRVLAGCFILYGVALGGSALAAAPRG
ncbi:MAG: LysE family translocator [Pseudomonadota bacterium]